MLPLLTGDGANPSSPHGPGRRARMALDDAHERTRGRHRRTAAGARADERRNRGREPCGQGRGVGRSSRPVRASSRPRSSTRPCSKRARIWSAGASRRRSCRSTATAGRTPTSSPGPLDEKVVLVSLQLANNEVGTVQPLADLIARVRDAGRALVHVDAVAGAAWLPLDVVALGADLVSLAAHKLEGPKGAGRAVDPARDGGRPADPWREPGALPASGHRGRRSCGRHGGRVRARGRRALRDRGRGGRQA